MTQQNQGQRKEERKLNKGTAKDGDKLIKNGVASVHDNAQRLDVQWLQTHVIAW